MLFMSKDIVVSFVSLSPQVLGIILMTNKCLSSPFLKTNSVKWKMMPDGVFVCANVYLLQNITEIKT